MNAPALCWRLERGRMQAAPIPSSGLPIAAAPLELDGREALALPGREGPHWRTWTLRRVRTIAERITPGATWFFAPGFSDPDAPGAMDFSGFARWPEDVIRLRSSLHPACAVEIAFHESWHLVAQHLDPAEAVLVAEAVSRSRDWPDDDYHGTPCEKAARLFAAWAVAADLAGEPLVGGGRAAYTRVFADAYNGEIAIRAARRRHIPAARLPPALAARLAAERAAPVPASSRIWRALVG